MEIAANYQFVIVLIAISQASQLKIKSNPQFHVLKAEDTVMLECEFQANRYNLFDFPVLWRKSQLGEETQVNIMGNVVEPFMLTNRFEVAFSSNMGVFRFELTITDVKHEDSGNYTCEVRGPQSVVIDQVTHHVYVQVLLNPHAPAVQSVVISDANANTIDHSTETSRTIHLVENRPETLRCAAFGGYPPPSVYIYIGGHDVTTQFQYSQNATMTGRRGLRNVTYRSDRWKYDYIPSANDDEAKFQCVATVTDMQSYTQTVHLWIDYSPKINCSVEMRVEDPVAVHCDVRSKPLADSYLWIIDSNGTTLTSDDDFVTISERAERVVRVSLDIVHFKSQMYRKYILEVKNKLFASSRQEILVAKPTKNRATLARPQHGKQTSTERNIVPIKSRDTPKRSSSIFASSSSILLPPCCLALLLLYSAALSKTVTVYLFS